MSRRNGRILAVQGLYSYDVGSIPLEDLLKLEWTEGDPVSETLLLEELKKNPETEEPSESKNEACDFARLIISGTINHIDEIDNAIKSHLTGSWDFNRLNKVTLAILRISIFALLYQKDLAPGVVIDEAISISKQFGTDDSFKFINAVLDNISKGK